MNHPRGAKACSCDRCQGRLPQTSRYTFNQLLRFFNAPQRSLPQTRTPPDRSDRDGLF